MSIQIERLERERKALASTIIDQRIKLRSAEITIARLKEELAAAREQWKNAYGTIPPYSQARNDADLQL